MIMTFKKFWPDSTEKDIREYKAPEFIRSLRYSLGPNGTKLTMAEFQRLLNERVGNPSPGDVSKQAKWETTKKRDGKRQFPSPQMQQGIIQLYLERDSNSAYLKDVGFPLPLWVDALRKMFFLNRFEELKPLLDREISCGPRGESDVHQDTWPFISMLRGNVAFLEKDYANASEYYDDAASLGIETKALSITIHENMIGAAFNRVRENDVITEEDAHIEYESILDICNELNKLDPKNHSFRRNRLRVLSRLNKENEFSDEFNSLSRHSDKDKLEKMFLSDKENDLANARNYECVIEFFRSREAHTKKLSVSIASPMMILS